MSLRVPPRSAVADGYSSVARADAGADNLGAYYSSDDGDANLRSPDALRALLSLPVADAQPNADAQSNGDLGHAPLVGGDDSGFGGEASARAFAGLMQHAATAAVAIWLGIAPMPRQMSMPRQMARTMMGAGDWSWRRAQCTAHDAAAPQPAVLRRSCDDRHVVWRRIGTQQPYAWASSCVRALLPAPHSPDPSHPALPCSPCHLLICCPLLIC